jgi:hypothetical protein
VAAEGPDRRGDLAYRHSYWAAEGPGKVVDAEEEPSSSLDGVCEPENWDVTLRQAGETGGDDEKVGRSASVERPKGFGALCAEMQPGFVDGVASWHARGECENPVEGMPLGPHHRHLHPRLSSP